MTKKRIMTYLLLMMLPFITGCLTSDTDMSLKTSTGSGVLTVSMTDVPLQNVQRLNVKISEVSVKKILTGEVEEWVQLKSDVPMFNIMDYRNGIMYMLGNKQMEPGIYSQFKIKFIEAELVENSVIHEMEISENFTEGVFLNYNFEVTETTDIDVVMDLDVERSVTENNGTYTFTPVIRVTEKSKAGSISGKVYPADSLAKVEAYNNDGERVSASIIRSDGSFVLAYLPPGSYDLMIISNGYEINTSAKNIIVRAGIITPGLQINLTSD
ncbi:DUF4382 domain-containing protein [bacterium]|nr:DUF4382 domain-containing protein [bacterium]